MNLRKSKKSDKKAKTELKSGVKPKAKLKLNKKELLALKGGRCCESPKDLN